MSLDCGIDYARLHGWLEDELELSADERGAWRFTFADEECAITLTVLENRRLGRFDLPRTELAVVGGAAALDELQRRFTLRFASAGG